MTEFLLVVVLAIALGWPLGVYLAKVMRGAPMAGDRVFGLVERPLYALLGVRRDASGRVLGMSWRTYTGAFVLSNLVLGVLVWTQFMVQAWLPLNPDAVPNMRWDLALHTMVSFLTNTNQQHYSGQAQLSYLSQMVGIVGLQVVTPMMGLALAVATLRALFGGASASQVDAVPASNADASARPWMAGQGIPEPSTSRQGRLASDNYESARDGHDAPVEHVATAARAHAIAREPDVGNYYADVVRATLRFLLPLCLVWSLLLTSQGVPATLQGGPAATPIDASAGMATQKIALGPVSPMVAIKQLGTNGGGWYGPNSSVPLENPTPFSNLLEMLALILIPVAVVFMIGPLTGRRRFTPFVLGVMLAMSLLSAGAAVVSEGHSATTTDVALMEGKETRFGADPSALWASLTTQTSNGSVNSMHDSLSPLTGGVAMVNMLVNAIWGGIGSGLQQFMTYLLLGVFLAGLMTGRTPELFGRKIEAPEIRLLALLILLQPLVLLGLTAVTLAYPALTGNSNPGFHAVSQVFYEYTSAFANNGSGFEGLGDNTLWWNTTCALVLALGRYPAMIVPLAVAGLLARKRKAPDSAGSLQIESPTFALTLLAVIAVLTVLQFMPALVLGPIADHLSLAVH